MLTRSNAWAGRFALVVMIAIAACTGGGAPAASPSVSSPLTAASSSPAATVAAPLSAAPASPTPAAASPSPTVAINRDRCPAELPPADSTTADGIRISGDAAFIAHVTKALDLIKAKAAASYADVVASVSMISQVESFSGMCFDTGRYRVGQETAYAPGHTVANQVVWLAGTIVHDGRHRARFVEGLEPSGRDAELDCLEHQVAALRKIETGTYFGDYVQGLIDGVDDPANQYWTNPDRHW